MCWHNIFKNQGIFTMTHKQNFTSVSILNDCFYKIGKIVLLFGEANRDIGGPDEINTPPCY